MKKIIRICLPVLLFYFNNAHAQFQYVSPMPGSVMNNPEHNIIIREGSIIEPASLQDRVFTLHGSRSGDHTFSTTLCRDGKTILLAPDVRFDYNEQVTVTVGMGLQSVDGRQLKSYSFSFETHRKYTDEEIMNFKNAKKMLGEEEPQQYVNHDRADGDTRDLDGLFTITTNNNPSPGDIFFDSFSAFFFPNSWTGYHVITSSGDSVYSQELNDVSDFKMEHNGNFGVRNGDEDNFEELDSNFNVINKIYGANGYSVDFHEMQITPDHHVFIIADDNEVIDMTVYNPSYSTHATVLGSVIQEFDPDGNLVFEWKSFDHVAPNEAQHINLGSSYIDYIHTNAIEVDNDGNILVSNRHLDQVNKISTSTGNFIWRMGGVMNQFTFTNDPEKFTFQHDIRRLANGNVTLWDNGNYHAVAHSTAKEYQLDEVNKTATLVWSYGHPGGVGGNSMYFTAGGSVQRLSNGNTLINGGWRSNNQNPSMFEVTPTGTIVWELKLDPGKSMTSYRAHKYEWNPCARPTANKLATKNITASSANIKWTGVAGAVKYKVQYKKHSDAVWTDKILSYTKHSLALTGLTASTKYDWRIETWCDGMGTKNSGYTAIKKFTTLPQRVFLTDDETAVDVSLFPNPAHNSLSVEASSAINQIRILDLLGRVVMNLEMNQQEAVSKVQVQLGNLPAGNYLVEIHSDNQQEVKKLVIE